MANISLLGGTTRIEVPFIKITIGDYTFGVYNKESAVVQGNNGFYKQASIKYPNYVQSLDIVKINGQVNKYTLNLIYPIRPGDDPNFFEKVFSSIGKSRKIIFSYGDVSLPSYIYKNEQAIITNITSQFDIQNSKISYTVQATSSAQLGYSGSVVGEAYSSEKPSNVIKKILQNQDYGLKDLFYGMNNMAIVNQLGLIAADDKAVKIDAKIGMSPLEYLNYLVGCMIPEGASSNNNKQNTFYVLTIHDDVDGQNINGSNLKYLGGPYFKITKVSKSIQHADAYELIIGYPTQNIITSFSIENNENYSIYYDYQKELSSTEYVLRLNDKGEWEEEYSPRIGAQTKNGLSNTAENVWWSKITQYPITATVTLKGLLRPATLMQYVNLKVLFFGNKHISSGLYIVTKQQDSISTRGYKTTLTLTRVAPMNDFSTITNTSYTSKTSM